MKCRDAIREIVGVLARIRPNVMVLGNRAEIHDVLAAIAPYLVPPVTRWSPANTSLPDSEYRTLIVNDASQLTEQQQHELVRHLASGRGLVQVITTSTESLFTWVSEGRFLDSLYYRLNTILIQAWQDAGSRF